MRKGFFNFSKIVFKSWYASKEITKNKLLIYHSNLSTEFFFTIQVFQTNHFITFAIVNEVYT